ncbi:MAG: hypothetical protein FJY20_03215 [Bacteroidetes bacterium]|nr:hypothetical protein [Bacteroidota bacterium]
MFRRWKSDLCVLRLIQLNYSSQQKTPTRLEVTSTFIKPGGEAEIKTGIDYIYSLNELGNMLQSAGLGLKKVYSIPGRKEFTLGEPRAYLVAQKG